MYRNSRGPLISTPYKRNRKYLFFRSHSTQNETIDLSYTVLSPKKIALEYGRLKWYHESNPETSPNDRALKKNRKCIDSRWMSRAGTTVVTIYKLPGSRLYGGICKFIRLEKHVSESANPQVVIEAMQQVRFLLIHI